MCAREIERRMRRTVSEWRSRLTCDIAEARQAFRELLTTQIQFTPFIKRGYRGIRFEGRWGLEAVFGSEILVTKMASPTGTVKRWQLRVSGFSDLKVA